jgi:hypothetical protein
MLMATEPDSGKKKARVTGLEMVAGTGFESDENDDA